MTEEPFLTKNDLEDNSSLLCFEYRVQVPCKEEDLSPFVNREQILNRPQRKEKRTRSLANSAHQNPLPMDSFTSNYLDSFTLPHPYTFIYILFGKEHETILDLPSFDLASNSKNVPPNLKKMLDNLGLEPDSQLNQSIFAIIKDIYGNNVEKSFQSISNDEIFESWTNTFKGNMENKDEHVMVFEKFSEFLEAIPQDDYQIKDLTSLYSLHILACCLHISIYIIIFPSLSEEETFFPFNFRVGLKDATHCLYFGAIGCKNFNSILYFHLVPKQQKNNSEVKESKDKLLSVYVSEKGNSAVHLILPDETHSKKINQIQLKSKSKSEFSFPSLSLESKKSGRSKSIIFDLGQGSIFNNSNQLIYSALNSLMSVSPPGDTSPPRSFPLDHEQFDEFFMSGNSSEKLLIQKRAIPDEIRKGEEIFYSLNLSDIFEKLKLLPQLNKQNYFVYFNNPENCLYIKMKCTLSMFKHSLESEDKKYPIWNTGHLSWTNSLNKQERTTLKDKLRGFCFDYQNEKSKKNMEEITKTLKNNIECIKNGPISYLKDFIEDIDNAFDEYQRMILFLESKNLLNEMIDPKSQEYILVSTNSYELQNNSTESTQPTAGVDFDEFCRYLKEKNLFKFSNPFRYSIKPSEIREKIQNEIQKEIQENIQKENQENFPEKKRWNLYTIYRFLTSSLSSQFPSISIFTQLRILNVWKGYNHYIVLACNSFIKDYYKMMLFSIPFEDVILDYLRPEYSDFPDICKLKSADFSLFSSNEKILISFETNDKHFTYFFMIDERDHIELYKKQENNDSIFYLFNTENEIKEFNNPDYFVKVFFNDPNDYIAIRKKSDEQLTVFSEEEDILDVSCNPELTWISFDDGNATYYELDFIKQHQKYELGSSQDSIFAKHSYIPSNQREQYMNYNFIAKPGLIEASIDQIKSYQGLNEWNFFSRLTELLPVLLVDEDSPMPKIISPTGYPISLHTSSPNLIGSIHSYYLQLSSGINFQHIQSFLDRIENKNVIVNVCMAFTSKPENAKNFIDTLYGTQFFGAGVKGVWASVRFFKNVNSLIIFFNHNETNPNEVVELYKYASDGINGIHLKLISDFLSQTNVTNDQSFIKVYSTKNPESVVESEMQILNSKTQNEGTFEAKRFIARYLTLMTYQNTMPLESIMKIIKKNE